VPIVVLNGLDDEHLSLLAVKSGARDYLIKGKANGALLMRAIRYAIERHATDEALRRAHDKLEARVKERTAELELANQALKKEVAERDQAEAVIRGLNAQLEERLRRIDALRQIDRAISSSLDLRLTLEVILAHIKAELHVDATAALLCGHNSPALEYSSGTGFRTDGITRSRVMLGQGLAGRCALKRRPVSIPTLSQPSESFSRAALLVGEGFVSYYAVPLVARGHVKGVLEIFHRSPLTLDTEFRDFLDTLAGQAAVAIDNARLWEDSERNQVELTVAYDATIEGWARALDMRDKETEGHTRRVTDMTVRLARAMGLGEAELVHVRRGALLHDIGKMAISDCILLKADPLTEAEWAILRRHPDYAHEWLSPISFLRQALDIPYCHHEKWNGSGYPRGISKERIPLSARIFSAVDVWDALRFDRPYRAGWPEQRVIEHIQSLAETDLDPQVVEVFLQILTGGRESYAV
jgi:HD-GYP domain-containing protein (c-di-GMP phosphodiesterase class II)